MKGVSISDAARYNDKRTAHLKGVIARLYNPLAQTHTGFAVVGPYFKGYRQT